MATWNLAGTKHHLLICNGGSCMREGGEEVTQAIRDEIARSDVDSLIHTTRTRCNGRCDDACIVILYPQGIWYREMTPETGRRMVNELLGDVVPLANQIVYAYKDGLVPNGSVRTGIEKKR
jgi:(2Fe-2S) ferredoxin